MSEFLIILGMAVVTYSVRYPPLAAVGRINLPDSVRKALEFVPVAVLSAIILPAVVFPTGDQPVLNLQNPYLIASLASALIAMRTKNLLWTIVLGLMIFLAWKWLVVPIFLS